MPAPAARGRIPLRRRFPIPNETFWRGRRVFATGFTGFEGARLDGVIEEKIRRCGAVG
jgi:hypothetical protein